MFGTAVRHKQMRAGLVTAAVLAATLATVSTPLAADAATPAGAPVALPAGTTPAATPATSPAVVVGQHWVSERTLHLDLATSAFATTAPVEVTFPVGYDAKPRKRWPVTYYLHGTNHDQTAFRVAYDGERVTQGFGSIVVSPNGASGYWSDWTNPGLAGPHLYETFVTQQLVPLVDRLFRTVPDRAHRAIMGESMGGFGVMSLAALHPDLFGAAASLSGTVDTNLPANAAAVTVSPVLMGAAPDSIFGPRLTQEAVWRAHNPWDIAANLRDVDLQLFTGSGTYDPTHGETVVEASAGCALEGLAILPSSTSLHERLLALGIRHRWVPLTWGCHGVALFQHEMSLATQRLTRVFATPPTAAR